MNDKHKDLIMRNALSDTHARRRKVLEFWDDAGKEPHKQDLAELERELASLREYARKSVVINFNLIEYIDEVVSEVELENKAHDYGFNLIAMDAVEDGEDEDEDEE